MCVKLCAATFNSLIRTTCLTKPFRWYSVAAAASLPVEHNGELVGMLTLESVGEFMMIHSAMRRAEQAAQSPQATPSLT